MYPDRYGRLRNAIRPSVRLVLTWLSRLEQRASSGYRLRYSPTFILGVPRSGSTLLYQLMCHALSTSYFTNLAARLRVHGSPALPVWGAHLAKWLAVVDRYQETFDSYYGNVMGWGAPSAGREMWDHWFPDRHVGPGELPSAVRRTIYHAVAGTERVLDRPFVNKDQKHTVRLPALVEIFPTALFVVCRRDPLAVAQSIYIGRTRDFPHVIGNHADPRLVWFSTRPKQYDDIKDKELIDQICEQVYFNEQNIDDDREAIPGARFHIVEYGDICRDPRRVIDGIAEFMNSHGAPTRVIRSTPPSFPYSTGCRIDRPIYLALAGRLERLYGRRMDTGPCGLHTKP